MRGINVSGVASILKQIQLRIRLQSLKDTKVLSIVYLRMTFILLTEKILVPKTVRSQWVDSIGIQLALQFVWIFGAISSVPQVRH